MRLRASCFAVLALTAATPMTAEDLTIVSKVSTDGGPAVTATSYVSATHIRMAQPEGTESMMDVKTGEMTIINGRKKEYYVISRQELDQEIARTEERMKTPMFGPKAQALPPEAQKRALDQMALFGLKVQRMGTTRKIAGYTCEDWTVTVSVRSINERCMTNELALATQAWTAYRDFVEGLTSMSVGFVPPGKTLRDVQQELKDARGFPLWAKRTVKVMGQPSTSTLEVVEVKKGPIPASAWQVPTGYKKVDNPLQARSSSP